LEYLKKSSSYPQTILLSGFRGFLIPINYGSPRGIPDAAFLALGVPADGLETVFDDASSSY
jgi:hypothetical protein